MAMRCSRSRLLAFALIFYLKLSECIGILNAEPIPKDPLTFSERQNPLQKPPHDTRESDVTRIRESDRKGRIEASIIPLNSSESKPEYTQAEVRILIPSSPKATNPQADWLIRASSILMDYDEDTRKFFPPKDSVNSKPHRIRHQNHRKLPSGPITDDYFAPNEAQLDEPISREEITSELQTTSKPRSIVRIPVRALYYGDDQLIPTRKVSRKKSRANKVKNEGNDTWIALHSPVRIYIPVRYNEDSSIPSHTKCVHCSPNITITVPRGETEVAVPAPAITVCSRLARTRGRINIAVVSGPRPGVRVVQGDYPTEIIVWKPGGHVFSCIYKLTVVVKKCDKILPPSGGSVDCLNGNFWGSKCKFSCFPGFVLQGHHTVTCEEHSNEVFWSSSSPICKNAVSAHVPTIKRLPCSKPLQPKDGTIICHSNSQNDYADGSVCQYFCFPGFLIESLLTTSSLIVCKNGQWTPNGNVSCLATYCSEPRSPSYGSMRCNHKGIKDTNVKSKYQNGTTCSFHCDSGYTIPKSLSSLNRIVCNAPHWNDSSIPECKQMVAPYPHPKDCSNQTRIVNRRGFVKLKPVRFYLKKNAFSSKTMIYGNCSHSGKISVGTYINHCTSYDSELNTTGQCTYSITVKENSCSPPPKVLHGSLQCETGDHSSYPRRTICKYICDDGYVIPIKERKFQSKVCMPKLKWRPPGFPTCKRAIPPKPRRGMCISQTLYLEGNDSTITIKTPRFKSSLKGSKVRVSCSLNGPLQIGNYTNVCEAMDTQLGLNSSCKFDVTIQGKGCPSLPDVSFGLINCSDTLTADYLPVGTICSYSCDKGNTIPTSLLAYSVKMCIGHHWNSSLPPACVSQIPPVPAVDSCLNRSVTIENLADVDIDIPEFKSSSGAILGANCEPQNISTFITHKINCSAFDPQLRVTGFCSFYLDVQNSNEIAELSREEVSCQRLEEIENGYAQCNHNNSGVLPVGSICEVVCKEDFTVPNTQINQSAVECLPNGQWNSTNISECMKLESPILISGCADHDRKVSNLSSLKVPLPIFLTSQNISAVVSCMPETMEDYGNHKISCIADDNELNTKATCSFYFNLVPVINESSDLSSDFPTTISEPSSTVTISTTESTAKSCEELNLPHHGFVNCSNSLSLQNCTVGCKEGYGFPSNYRTLHKGWIECDGTDGLWDFQRNHDSKHFPDCLGELPNTVVKVWLSFSSVVDHCDDANKDALKDIIKPLLIKRNEEMCTYVDCESSFQVNCSKNSSEKDILYTNWTLQTLFNPADYEHSRDVPDPETHIEKILDATHAAVTSDSHFRDALFLNGMQLNENSFQRGFFVLVCQKEGYAVDTKTNKCVECPSGTREQNGNCVECPKRTFQLEPGQTVCEECPDATFFTQNVPLTCLDEDDNVPAAETSYLSALTAS